MFANRPRNCRTITRVLLCFSVMTLMLADSPEQSSSAKSKSHTISIGDMKYLPGTLIVNAGDTVVWKNDDVVPHTATARNKSFDSGGIDPGGSWSYVAKKKGTYLYYCDYHLNMKGKLIVR